MFDIDCLRGKTHATVRAAFNSSAEILEEYGDAGSCNITSILTRIIRDVGRFSERWSSDALYSIDKLRELAEEKYRIDPENPFDEIICFGIRQDGVDHNAYIMCNLAKYRDMFTGYVFPKQYYRRILAVRCRARFEQGLRCTRATFSLRDITDGFHSIEPADLKENKIDPVDLPYGDLHEPEIQTECYKLDRTDIEKARLESLKTFAWEEASEKEYARMRKYGCAGDFRCYIISGTHDDPVLLPNETPEEVCRVFISGQTAVASWAKPGYEYYSDAVKLADHIRTVNGITGDTAGASESPERR